MTSENRVRKVVETPLPAPAVVRTIECFGSCLTRAGRRAVRPHAVSDVQLNGDPFFKTTCLSCLHVSYMDPNTGNVVIRTAVV